VHSFIGRDGLRAVPFFSLLWGEMISRTARSVPPIENLIFAIYFEAFLSLKDIENSMKKFLTLIAMVSLGLGACERHPVSQLPKEADSKEGAVKSDESKSKESAPEASASGTPKTYFPRNSQ